MSFFSNSTQKLDYTQEFLQLIDEYKTRINRNDYHYNLQAAAEEMFSILKTKITIVDEEAAKKLINVICYYVRMKPYSNDKMYIIYDANKKSCIINDYYASGRSVARPSDEIIDVNDIIPALINMNMLKPYRPMLDFVRANIPSSGGKKTKSKKTKSKKNKSKKNKTRRNRK